MRLVLPQGTNRIAQANDVVDGNGNALVLDGWSVIAAARAETPGGTLLQVWTNDPGEGQGEAVAAGRQLQVFITPEQTNTWPPADRVVLQAFVTSPSGDQTERLIYETYNFERSVLPT